MSKFSILCERTPRFAKCPECDEMVKLTELDETNLEQGDAYVKCECKHTFKVEQKQSFRFQVSEEFARELFPNELRGVAFKAT